MAALDPEMLHLEITLFDNRACHPVIAFHRLRDLRIELKIESPCRRAGGI